MSARTITFKALLERTAGRIGITVDYTAGSRFLLEAPALAQYLSDASRQSWDAYAWPESLTDTPDFAPTDQYLIPWDNVGKGSYQEVWNTNPDTDRNARKLGISNRAAGLVIDFSDRPAAGNTVYLRYRGDAPVYSYSAYDGGTAYVAGDVVYYSTDGNCYMAIASTTGNAPTDDTKWTLQPVLLILAPAMQHYGRASWLIAAGQTDASRNANGEALDSLDDEWGKLAAQDSKFRHKGR
jgi:hypothetical protein